jgi:hypothetical protein
MKKWEYVIVQVEPDKERYNTTGEQRKELQGKLNVWGSEGWELVHITEGGLMFFKRQKPDCSHPFARTGECPECGEYIRENKHDGND